MDHGYLFAKKWNINMNKKYITLTIFFLILFYHCSFAQKDSLKSKIESIANSIKARVGVAVINLNSHDTLSFRGNEKFPMQSVYKFPLAIAVLNKIDSGKYSLSQKIHITKNDLLPDTWSPLRDKYPDGNVDVPLEEILNFTVSQSDNNGCDIFFRLVGGTSTVEKYIHSLGIKDMGIVATEEEMHKDWNIQYKNFSTPIAMGKLLEKFYSGKILSEDSKQHLWKYMADTFTGPKRIKGLLPLGTIAAHKTGSSGTDDKGITPATNDVGIVRLPDGSTFIIVVFVSDSSADNDTNELVIAKITKAVWDYFR